MAGASEAGQQVGTLPQAMRRDFSAVDYGEAMRRAREIVPVLRERAQQAEDARMLIRENEQLLHESGLFRFHQPQAFGGMELPFVAVVDIPAELARGCPSTAWNVTARVASPDGSRGFQPTEKRTCFRRVAAFESNAATNVEWRTPIPHFFTVSYSVRRTANVDPPIFPHDPNVVALATDHTVHNQLPVLDLNDPDKIAAFITQLLQLPAPRV